MNIMFVFRFPLAYKTEGTVDGNDLLLVIRLPVVPLSSPHIAHVTLFVLCCHARVPKSSLLQMSDMAFEDLCVFCN